MASQTPQQFYDTFAERLFAGDIEALLQYYEPDGVLLGAPGEVTAGAENLRAVLLQFIALKPTFAPVVREVIEAGDTLLVSAPWTLTGTSPDGPVTLGGVTTDVLRRRPDGTLRYLIDQPWGDTMAKA
jgi:ketosteroid isomerase-like protein